jgi:hypothetical protein
MAEVATDSSEWSDVKQDGSEIDEAVKRGRSSQKANGEAHSKDEKFLQEADRALLVSQDEAKLFRRYYALEKRIERERDFPSQGAHVLVAGIQCEELGDAIVCPRVDRSVEALKGSRGQGRVDIAAAEGR